MNTAAFPSDESIFHLRRRIYSQGKIRQKKERKKEKRTRAYRSYIHAHETSRNSQRAESAKGTRHTRKRCRRYARDETATWIIHETEHNRPTAQPRRYVVFSALYIYSLCMYISFCARAGATFSSLAERGLRGCGRVERSLMRRFSVF